MAPPIKKPSVNQMGLDFSGAKRTTKHEREPEKEDSARGRVATLLKTNEGAWVRASEITHPAVGGSEGLRRVRELRAKGWNITQRKREDSTEREYRLEKEG